MPIEKWVFLGIGLGAGYLAASLLSDPPSAQDYEARSDSPAKVLDSSSPTGRTDTTDLQYGSGGAAPNSLYGEIERAEAGGFPAILESVLGLDPDSPQREALLDLLFDRWAMKDPVGVLEAATALRGSARDSAFKSALTRLGTENFSETLAWMNDHMSYSARSSSQLWLYVGLAKKDPLLAIDEIGKLSDGEIKESALLNVASEWAKTDVMAAFKWYENAPWNGKMVDVYNRLMDAYLEQKPEEAQAFIDAMPDDLYTKKKLQLDLVTLMAGRDVESALLMSGKIEDPRRKDSALTNVFEAWAEADPEAALSKAIEISQDDTVDKSTQNNVARQAAFAMLWEDTANLKENYDKIPEDIRQELVGPFVQKLMMEDPVTATEWVLEFPPDSVEYNIGLSGVAMALNDWNPEEAIRTVQAMTFSDIRNDNIYSSLKSLYKQNPQRALEVASDPNLVDPSIRDGLARWIGEFGDQRPDIYIPGSTAEE